MPRVKDVLELAKQYYGHAKPTPVAAGKKAAPPNGRNAEPAYKDFTSKDITSSRVEVTRAV